MPNRLEEVLDGLQARLQGELLGNRSALVHPGARGSATEEDWLRLLRAHLPSRYQAERGFVLDSEGNGSEFIDVIVFDRQYSPLIYNQADQRYVPAESVYGVLEIKQDLTRDHIVYAAQKAESVRRLKRTSAPIAYAAGVYAPRPLPRILAGLIAYESSWSPPFGEPLSRVLAGLSTDQQLNIGCALTSGVFEVRYQEGTAPHVAVFEGRRSLVQFLWRLLKGLQALGTAPAIDYDEYLGQLSGEGPLQRAADAGNR